MIGRAELERRRAELLQASTEAASYRTQLRGLGMTEAQIQPAGNNAQAERRLSHRHAQEAEPCLKREITIGQVVQPADPAFTIADLSSVWIVANVPEEDAGRLQKGMEVEVRIPALPKAEDYRQSFVCLSDCRSGHANGGGPYGCGKPERTAQAR